MLSFIKGLLVEKATESPKGAYFLVDVHGVGFEVLSSHRSIEQSPPPGQEILLYTSMIVREDAMFLVGFASREERDLFNILQSASGVGIKVALALLSTLSVSEIVQAVVANNHPVLSRAKGVGSKLAQKIALELKEKMLNWRPMDAGLPTAHEGFRPNTEAWREAESVLLSLGYQPDEISRSFKSINEQLPEDVSSEELLRESLRWLAHSV
ncbi:MAG TPA: Holliday junction branch migration protein RuvA [Oculatellaceae cyanobacterium]